MITKLIEIVYSFLWGDLIQIPLPGGSSVGISLLIILLIPMGIYFTVRTRFLPIRLFPDMVRALVGTKAKKDADGKSEKKEKKSPVWWIPGWSGLLYASLYGAEAEKEKALFPDRSIICDIGTDLLVRHQSGDQQFSDFFFRKCILCSAPLYNHRACSTCGSDRIAEERNCESTGSFSTGYGGMLFRSDDRDHFQEYRKPSSGF